MDYTKASLQQLLHIAYHEVCPKHYKVQALIELQNRSEKTISRSISRFKNKAAYSDEVYLI